MPSAMQLAVQQLDTSSQPGSVSVPELLIPQYVSSEVAMLPAPSIHNPVLHQQNLS